MTMMACALAMSMFNSLNIQPANVSGPRLRIVLQERGLRVISAEAVPIINKELQALTSEGKLHLNDVSIVVNTHKIGVGKVDFNLTNIVIASLGFSVNGTQIELLDPTTSGPARFRLDLAGLAMDINADYRWKDVGGIIKASDHGYVNITASKGSCDVDMSLTPDGEKQPHLHSTVNLNIPQFDYKFHGKEAWIYNMLGSAVHGIVKKLVVSKVEAVILNITNVVLPNMIDNAPTSITVGGGKSTIQFGIKLEDFHEHASSPLSLSSGLSMAVGDAHDPDHVINCPMTARPIPPLAPRATDAMLQLLISDKTVSCVSWVLYRNGLLAEADLPFGTTETPWGLLIPQLKKKYPDLPVVLQIIPAYAPQVDSFHDRGLSGSAQFHVNMSVNTSGGALVYTDTLDVRARFGIDVSVHTLPDGANATLVGNVSKLNLTATVADSAIGPLPGGLLKLFASLFDGVVRAIINKVLRKGVPISPAGGLLHNTSVFTEDGYVTVAADFSKLLGSTQ